MKLKIKLLSAAICFLPCLSIAEDDTAIPKSEPQTPAAQLQKRNDWQVIYPGNQADLTNLRDVYYITIESRNNEWQVVGVSPAYKNRSSKFQEIFAADKNLKKWTPAIKEHAHCPHSQNDQYLPYSICNSQFGSFSTLGATASVLMTLGTSMLAAKPVSFDKDKIQQVVSSLDPVAVEAKVTELKDAQAKAAKDKAELDAKRMAEARVKVEQERAKNEELADKRKSAPVGTKDFCQGRSLNGSPASDVASYECQNYGPAAYAQLNREGWIIVNSMQRQINNIAQTGYTYDIVIEKIR